MGRIRYLKPDFFLSETVAELNFEERLFFQGLWVLADREGRLKDEPKKIKVQIMPYDEINPEKILSKLSTAKKPFILRYSIDGENYIQILGWSKHQKPHNTEKESIIPSPLTVKNTLNNGEITGLNGDGELKGNGEGNGELLYKDFESKIQTLWNSLCDKYPSLKKIKGITGTRRKKLKERFTEKNFKDFEEITKAISEQPFLLNGNSQSKNHSNWRVNFDWLIKNDTNYVKVLERVYTKIESKKDWKKIIEETNAKIL